MFVMCACEHSVYSYVAWLDWMRKWACLLCLTISHRHKRRVNIRLKSIPNTSVALPQIHIFKITTIAEMAPPT